MKYRNFFPSTILHCILLLLILVCIIVPLTFTSLLVFGLKSDSTALLFISIISSFVVILLLHFLNKKSNFIVNYNFKLRTIRNLGVCVLAIILFQFGVVSPCLWVFGNATKPEPIAIFSNLNVSYAIYALLVAPIAEEIIFRNYMLRGLTLSYSATKGIVFFSFFFAIAHFDISNLQISPVLTTFIAGLFLGWLFVKSGHHLGLVILLHSINNLVVLTKPLSILVRLNFGKIHGSGHLLIVGASIFGLYVILKYLSTIKHKKSDLQRSVIHSIKLDINDKNEKQKNKEIS